MKFAKSKYKTENEVEVYEKLVSLIRKQSNKMRNVLPSFIVEDALVYFSLKDKFEECKVLKDFVVNNPNRISLTTKRHWFEENL